MSSNLLQIFAKAPVAGEVKTRLAADIGHVKACTVYQSLLLSTVENTYSNGWDAELWCSPDTEDPVLQSIGKQYTIELLKQCDGDIGNRMLFALKSGIKKARKVVLIGSDSPVISASYIEQAFAALDTNDVVFGPVEDGGYVLIACNTTQDNMFNDVEWGSAVTLEQNIKAVERCGLSYGLLGALWDVDDINDYQRLLR
jgi:hypothetical protein